MPLQLLTPPTLVDVRGPDGSVRPALLLGRRDDRRFVQVRHAAGDNRLRWVAAADVQASSSPAPAPFEAAPFEAAPFEAAPFEAAPFKAATSAAVALSGPRSQR